MAGDFLLLSAVWIGAFALLTVLGRFIVQRLSRRSLIKPRKRLQGGLGYVLPYTLPTLICLPLTLYASHFLPTSIGRALVVRLRRPVAHLIRNRPLAQRLKHTALQQSLRVFPGGGTGRFY